LPITASNARGRRTASFKTAPGSTSKKSASATCAPVLRASASARAETSVPKTSRRDCASRLGDANDCLTAMACRSKRPSPQAGSNTASSAARTANAASSRATSFGV
jgi:hypothetical protein